MKRKTANTLDGIYGAPYEMAIILEDIQDAGLSAAERQGIAAAALLIRAALFNLPPHTEHTI